MHPDSSTSLVSCQLAALEKRFWSKVDRSAGPDGCWLWTAYRLPGGYGQFSIGNTLQRAHRVAWELTHGPIPAGMHCLHRCDNPSCVNPAHLFLGTQKDNVRDMRTKKRHDWSGLHLGRERLYPMGEGCSWHRLTADEVLEIRVRYAAGGISTRALAADYGVSGHHVWAIVSRKVWRHI